MFLGWDQPALPVAAAHLIEHYLKGGVADLRPATVVLPGQRARRRITELILEEAEVRGAKLIPPTATTVGNLPAKLHTNTTALADDVTCRRAWSLALRSTNRSTLEEIFPKLPDNSDLVAWEELAEILSGLHQSLAGEGHRFSDVARICTSGPLFDDGPRWRIMARVQERYLRLLQEVQLADQFEDRMATLESGVDSFTGDLWFVSIVELPSVTRRLVQASGAKVRALIHSPEGPEAESAFDDFGLPSTDYWNAAHVPVTNEVLHIVESPARQADAVIKFLRGLDSDYTTEDVVLAVHPRSDVVPYLEERLKACDVSPRYAAGTPISHTAPLRLLEAVADYRDDLSFLGLAALLRHPDAAPLINTGAVEITHLEAIDAADRYLNDHLPHRLKSNLPHGKRLAAQLPRLFNALERSGPLSQLKGYENLSQWMPLITDVLLTVYGDRDWDRRRLDHRGLLETLDQISTAATGLSTLPESLDEKCSASAAIRALLLELRGEALPPEPQHDAVELLDWLEIPLDDAPVVVLTGFNEDLLPESVRGDAFLPDTLRSLLGLTNNQARLARDAYRLTTVLYSKTVVHLIAGRRTIKGDPLLPSRLMFRIPEEEIATRVLHFFKRDGTDSVGLSLSDLGLQPAVKSEFLVPPERTLKYKVPHVLWVTDFKLILGDCYRFVLKRIYGLEYVDDTAQELDALPFGILAHDILQAFGQKALEYPPAVDITDAEEVGETLAELLDNEVSVRFSSAALPAVALQVEQLKARLRTFAEKQAEWASRGWQIVAVEQRANGDGVEFELPGGESILLQGRIDRIDYNPSLEEWALLDYKTSAKGESPEETHRKTTGEWKELQLPLYRHIARGILGEDDKPVVTFDKAREAGIKLGYVTLPQDPDKSGFKLANWTEADMASAEERAREAIHELMKGSVEFDPKVTKPNGRPGDVLEPLLARGWKAAESDSDVWDEESDIEGEAR